MTTQPEAGSSEGTPAVQITKPWRELIALVLVGANAVLLFVGLIDLFIPYSSNIGFSSRAGGSFFDFVGIEAIVLPLLAVLLATHIKPAVPRAKLITQAALVEYAVSAVFGVIALLAWLFGSLVDGEVRSAFTGLLVRIAYAGIFAAAAFVIFKVWRTLYYEPRPKPQPGVYGSAAGGPGYPPAGGPGGPGYGQQPPPSGFPPPPSFPGGAPGSTPPGGYGGPGHPGPAPSGPGQAGPGAPGQVGPGGPAQGPGGPAGLGGNQPGAQAGPSGAAPPARPASAPPAPQPGPFGPQPGPAAPQSGPPAAGPTPNAAQRPRPTPGPAARPAPDPSGDAPTAPIVTHDTDRTQVINPASQQPSAGSAPPPPASDDEPTRPDIR